VTPARTPLSIFGLGYVGCVNAACFSARGHAVIGVDVNSRKVEEISQGVSPIVEPRLTGLLRKGVRTGLLKTTTAPAEAVAASDISLICVGTPSLASGEPDSAHILEVCRQIGRALGRKQAYHLVVIRSTSLPGTVHRAAKAIEKAAGRSEGNGFGVCSNPEFLREGTAVADFLKPPMTVVGVRGEKDERILRELYRGIGGEFISTEVEAAEMIKYACNSYHAVKVTFANEIGILCAALGIDSHRVMDIFARDTKLNISKAYLRPGFAFGGSCLPKDLRALGYLARSLHREAPLLGATLVSNEAQIRALVERISGIRSRDVGFLGLAFKAGTDDLRESPLVRVAEWLYGKGYRLRIYDPNVSVSRLIGANRAYIEKEIPHIASLMADSPAQAIEGAGIVIVGNRDEAYLEALKDLKKGQVALDLVRLLPPGTKLRGRWEGLHW